MTTWTVTVTGCDDSTRIDIELDDLEAAAVSRVSEAITAASGEICQPRMSIKLATDGEDE